MVTAAHVFLVRLRNKDLMQRRFELHGLRDSHDVRFVRG